MHVTIIMAYYENAGMLKRHYDAFRAFAPEVKAHMSYIVVDDGSPTSPAPKPETPLGFPFLLYRIEKDIRWNQDACRNIGAHNAEKGWLLLTDMDHMVPEETVRIITTELSLDGETAYKFSRVSEPEFDPYKVHPNTWLMRRELFHRIGGYDERFAGWYGTDSDFRDHVHNYARDIRQLDQVIVRIPRQVTPDASCPATYGRKNGLDKTMIARIKAHREASKDKRPKILTFPYKLVHEETLREVVS